MDKLEKALFEAGWNKETIDYYLKNDPIIPAPISLTTFEVETSVDKANIVEYPVIAESSSIVFNNK